MNQPAQRRDGARTMTQTYPIPRMPYRLDWHREHPHNRALRDEQRRNAQDRAHDRRMARQADKAAAKAADAALMASPEMVARKSAALAAAAALVAQMAAPRLSPVAL